MKSLFFFKFFCEARVKIQDQNLEYNLLQKLTFNQISITYLKQ